MNNIVLIISTVLLMLSIRAEATDTLALSKYNDCLSARQSEVMRVEKSSDKVAFSGIENLNDYYKIILKDKYNSQPRVIFTPFPLELGQSYLIAFQKKEKDKFSKQSVFDRLTVNVWPKDYGCLLGWSYENNLDKYFSNFFNNISESKLFSKKVIFLFKENKYMYYFLPPSIVVQALLDKDGKFKFHKFKFLLQSYIDSKGNLIYPDQSKLSELFEMNQK